MADPIASSNDELLRSSFGHDAVLARQFFDLIDVMISNQNSYRHLLSHRGQEAQCLIDALQGILPFLHRVEKAKVLKAHLRLSRKSNLLPSSFYVRNIEHIKCIVETPSVDIYRGDYQGRAVCLKKYRFCTGGPDRDYISELLHREAIIWANHRYVGILRFIGVYQRDDGPFGRGVYLVSPFMEHGTINQYLSSTPHANRCLLMKDVTAALAYLHDNSIVHGDIKGANILVQPSGRACVADLGFSRIGNASAILTWTTIQSVASVGTLPWQAPEIIQALCNSAPFAPTAAGDMYSLGCLAYEVFTNNPPFANIQHGAAAVWRVYHIINEVVIHNRRPARPDSVAEAYTFCGLTDEIWVIMERCWLRDPSLRPTAIQIHCMSPFRGIEDGRPVHGG